MIEKTLCIEINYLQSNATDSKSVELRFMSVRVGLGVPISENFNFTALLLMTDISFFDIRKSS